jgi:hypothetical protein
VTIADQAIVEEEDEDEEEGSFSNKLSERKLKKIDEESESDKRSRSQMSEYSNKGSNSF